MSQEKTREAAESVSSNTYEAAATSSTYEAALERSRRLEAKIAANPKRFRVLTGDRPTGRLHSAI